MTTTIEAPAQSSGFATEDMSYDAALTALDNALAVEARWQRVSDDLGRTWPDACLLWESVQGTADEMPAFRYYTQMWRLACGALTELMAAARHTSRAQTAVQRAETRASWLRRAH